MSDLGRYTWLEREPAPRILREALRHIGVAEVSGTGDSSTILSWARDLGLRDYQHDETAWCGLFMALCCKRSGYAVPRTPLWALSWKSWGTAVKAPMLADVLVFWRKVIDPRSRKTMLHGHVGQYVGEDRRAYHVLGGNQDNRVCVKRIARSRLVAARRCRWLEGQPRNIRKIRLTAFGALS
ncbi:MAG TPA: TIGR02594 family protein [Thermoanaerobaculia bacterium]|nr:TIGR02594 family protein [Thermoanaerobaculia bacterium]